MRARLCWLHRFRPAAASPPKIRIPVQHRLRRPRPRAANSSRENTLTGSLDEKKNGMFVVTDAEGTAYEFTYDPSDTPKGLDDAAEGDSVTVTYTGTVSEVDSFDGTVVSVEKAEAAQN